MKNLITIGISVAIAFLIGIQSVVAIQQTEATPDATPSGEVVPETDLPAFFSIRPVGDWDTTFFDNVEINPGQTVSLEIRVLNFGEGPLDLRVYTANATNPANGGMFAGQEEDEPLGPTSWIDFPAQDISLAPGEAHIMPLQVTVPEDASPGQYVSTFIAATIDTMPIPGSDTIDHRVRFSMPISILVPGELHFSFELGEPTLEANRLDIPITNTGNYRVQPAGQIELKNSNGAVILTAPIEMQSVYGGMSSSISIGLPAQLPEDTYTLSLQLEDPDSGAMGSLDDSAITVVVEEEPADYTVVSAIIEPNGEGIVFANVDVTINNNGDQMASTTIVLEVLHDEELVEEYPLATNQVFLRGENPYSTRYIPEDTWESGTYSFKIVVYAVDPNGGQQIELLNEELDSEIIVP